MLMRHFFWLSDDSKSKRVRPNGCWDAPQEAFCWRTAQRATVLFCSLTDAFLPLLSWNAIRMSILWQEQVISAFQAISHGILPAKQEPLCCCAEKSYLASSTTTTLPFPRRLLGSLDGLFSSNMRTKKEEAENLGGLCGIFRYAHHGPSSWLNSIEIGKDKPPF